MRALAREQDTGRALWEELQVDAGAEHAALVEKLKPALLEGQAIAPEAARGFVSSLALTLQCAVLARAGSQWVDALSRSRIGPGRGGVLGASPPLDTAAALVERVLPT